MDTNKKYSTDDLIQFAKVGHFGNETMNSLVLQALFHLKQLEAENAALKAALAKKA